MTEQPEPGFPSWRYGPDGAAQIFQSAADVPPGWTDHPGKLGEGSPAADEPAPMAEQCLASAQRSTAASRMRRRRLRAARRPVVLPA